MAFFDGSGQLTNVTSASPSTEYVKADGTVGTPSGGIASDTGVNPLGSNLVQLASSGTVTVNGTNQNYRVNITGTLTFDDSNLRSNITYSVFVSNVANTVNFPGTWNSKDGPTLTSRPALQNGQYVINVRKDSDGTNFWVATGRSFDLAPDASLVNTTNATTGVITQGVAPVQTNLQAIISTTVAAPPGTGGTVSLYASNQVYRILASTNVTVSFADQPLTNVVYTLDITNGATFTLPQVFVWKDTVSAPTIATGHYIIKYQRTSVTNAWLDKQPLLTPVEGYGLRIGTNNTLGTATLESTNRFWRNDGTNNNNIVLDFTTNTNEFWVFSTSRTNISFWPTNLVDGRSITVVVRPSNTADITFTNFGMTVYWPFGAGTNGTTSLTVTNGQGIEVNLRARTNTIWAAFSRFL